MQTIAVPFERGVNDTRVENDHLSGAVRRSNSTNGGVVLSATLKSSREVCTNSISVHRRARTNRSGLKSNVFKIPGENSKTVTRSNEDATSIELEVDLEPRPRTGTSDVDLALYVSGYNVQRNDHRRALGFARERSSMVFLRLAIARRRERVVRLAVARRNEAFKTNPAGPSRGCIVLLCVVTCTAKLLATMARCCCRMRSGRFVSSGVSQTNKSLSTTGVSQS
jgi:hypothetical protein